MHPGKFAETTPDKPAIVMAATGEVTTYPAAPSMANPAKKIMGAINPSNGIFYYTDDDGAQPIAHVFLYGFDTNTNTAIGTFGVVIAMTA